MAEIFKVETGEVPDYARLGATLARLPDCARVRRDDVINHPLQYTRGEVECIDAIDAAVSACPPDEAVCVANIIKYVWRYNDKTPVESLKKAKWYLDRLVEKVESRYMKETDQ